MTSADILGKNYIDSGPLGSRGCYSGCLFQDHDKDGDLDVYIGPELACYSNDGIGNFTEIADCGWSSGWIPRLPDADGLVNTVGQATTALFDVNFDGDQDGLYSYDSLLYVSTRNGHLYEAIGPSCTNVQVLSDDLNGDLRADLRCDSNVYLSSSTPTNFSLQPLGPFQLAYFDYDGDGDIDARDKSQGSIYDNNGVGGFSLQGTLRDVLPPGLTVVQWGGLGDADGDGDLDILVYGKTTSEAGYSVRVLFAQ